MALSATNPISIANALLKTLFTAKGQILVGTGSSTVSTLDPATNDYVLTLDSSTATGMKWAQTQAGMTDHWILESGTFTATPASTSTITMTSDRTTTLYPGFGLKYVIGGVEYYGIISAITSNLMTVRGAALTGDITSLSYTKTGVIQVPILIPYLYEDATNTTLIASDLKQTIKWMQGPSYLVAFDAKTRVKDTSNNGKINARVNGQDVCSTSGGLTLSSTSWFSTAVDISTTYYDINFGEEIELNATKGTTGDAEDLSTILTFVVK